MKKYKITVINPGSYSLKYEIIASDFQIVDGIHLFYDKNNSISHAFPGALTIIEEISNVK